MRKAIDKANLTLNPKKCSFEKRNLHFGESFSLQAAQDQTPKKLRLCKTSLHLKTEVNWKYFICMTQSNSDFIPKVSKNISSLREFLNSHNHYKWTETHQKGFQQCFGKTKEGNFVFLLWYSKPTFIFTDAHQSGLSAILAQGSAKHNAKPVAFASRYTSKTQTNHAKLNLEAMAVDFALRRFHLYLVGSPNDTS